MKKTGIVRKIDELGRIVIPKEIRKTLNVNSGEDLEIYLDEESIILKKYHKILNFEDSIRKYVDVFNKSFNNTIIITDNEKILAISEEYKNLKNQIISKELYKLMAERRKIQGTKIKITNLYETSYNYVLLPIVVNSDLEGSIIYLKNEPIEYSETQALELIKNLIVYSMKIE